MSTPATTETDTHAEHPSTLQVPGHEYASINHDGAPSATPSTSHTPTGSRAPSVRALSALPNNQIVYDDLDFTRPPGLNYSLRPRKKAIAIFWTLIVLDCVAMPIALYFGLWYGTGLSPNAGM
jgi:hypothetical protein